MPTGRLWTLGFEPITFRLGFKQQQMNRTLNSEKAVYRTSSCVCVPELVDAGQNGDGSVPDVAGVVHLAVLHLHLGVLQPEGDVAVVHVQRTLIYRARPAQQPEA